MTNCAALNPSVTATVANGGRVVGSGSGSLSYNVAFAGMSYGGGSAFSGSATHNGLDGNSASADEILTGGTLASMSAGSEWTTALMFLPGLSDAAVEAPLYLLTASSLPPFDAGTGYDRDPFLVKTSAQLAWLAARVNDGDNQSGIHYKLNNDIDLAAYCAAFGNGWIPVGSGTAPFGGVFDGAGKTIRNLFVNDDARDDVGLFGVIDGGAVRGLALEATVIVGGNNVGGVAGRIASGTVANCRVTGAVTGGDNVGGVAGNIGDGGRVANCYATCTVAGTRRIGGVAGNVSASGSVTNCAALNLVVRATGANAGRVAGSSDGSLSGNIAFAGMLDNAGLPYDIDPADIDHLDNIADGASPNGASASGATANGTSVSSVALLSGDGTLGNRFAVADGWVAAPGTLPTFTVPADLPVSFLFADGDGSASNPYVIRTVGQLRNLAVLVNAGNTSYNAADYLLGNSIAFSASDYGEGSAFNGGKGWIPVGTDAAPFRGYFDGGGNVIRNLYVNDGTLDYVGLFGKINGSVVGSGKGVKNLVLEAVEVTGKENVGGVTGWIAYGDVTNCSVSGTVGGNKNVGGVAGFISNDGNAANCGATCNVAGETGIGGVAGHVFSNGNATNCYASGTVAGANHIGGVAGYVFNNGNVANCYATGAVSGTNDTSLANDGRTQGGVGGVAGYVSGNVTNCAALNPSVTAPGTNVGRIAGNNAGGTLAGNIAFAGMLSFAGTPYGIDPADSADIDNIADIASVNPAPPTLSTLDGASVSALALITNNGTLGNRFAGGDGWVAAHGKLPTFTVAADLPCHIFSAGGTGTEADPYIIRTADHLRNLSVRVNAGDDCTGKHFLLANDIDLADYGATNTAFNGGKGWIPVGTGAGTPFNGDFNGNGKVIRNLYVNDPDRSYVGLFGIGGNGGTVRNLALDAVEIIGNNYVGGVTGAVENGTVTGSRVAGTVGGEQAVGGVTGLANGSVTNCYATCAVSGNQCIGGVAGIVGDMNIILGPGGNGASNGSVENCYATGAVTGNQSVGGLAGLVSYSSVTNCAALNSSVNGESGGRVAGSISQSTIQNNIVFAVSPGNPASLDGTPVSADELMAADAYPAAFTDGPPGLISPRISPA